MVASPSKPGHSVAVPAVSRLQEQRDQAATLPTSPVLPTRPELQLRPPPPLLVGCTSAPTMPGIIMGPMVPPAVVSTPAAPGPRLMRMMPGGTVSPPTAPFNSPEGLGAAGGGAGLPLSAGSLPQEPLAMGQREQIPGSGPCAATFQQPLPFPQVFPPPVTMAPPPLGPASATQPSSPDNMGMRGSQPPPAAAQHPGMHSLEEMTVPLDTRIERQVTEHLASIQGRVSAHAQEVLDHLMSLQDGLTNRFEHVDADRANLQKQVVAAQEAIGELDKQIERKVMDLMPSLQDVVVHEIAAHLDVNVDRKMMEQVASIHDGISSRFQLAAAERANIRESVTAVQDRVLESLGDIKQDIEAMQRNQRSSLNSMEAQKVQQEDLLSLHSVLERRFMEGLSTTVPQEHVERLQLEIESELNKVRFLIDESRNSVMRELQIHLQQTKHWLLKEMQVQLEEQQRSSGPAPQDPLGSFSWDRLQEMLGDLFQAERDARSQEIREERSRHQAAMDGFREEVQKALVPLQGNLKRPEIEQIVGAQLQLEREARSAITRSLESERNSYIQSLETERDARLHETSDLRISLQRMAEQLQELHAVCSPEEVQQQIEQCIRNRRDGVEGRFDEVKSAVQEEMSRYSRSATELSGDVHKLQQALHAVQTEVQRFSSRLDHAEEGSQTPQSKRLQAQVAGLERKFQQLQEADRPLSVEAGSQLTAPGEVVPAPRTVTKGIIEEGSNGGAPRQPGSIDQDLALLIQDVKLGLATLREELQTRLAREREHLLGQLEEQRRSIMEVVDRERTERRLENTEQRTEIARAMAEWHRRLKEEEGERVYEQ